MKAARQQSPIRPPDPITRIWEDYHRQMEYIAYGILQNRQDAEDAVQDAFLALAAHLETLEGMEDFRLYYYVTETARHKAIDLLRRRKAAVPFDDLTEDMLSDGSDFTEKIAAKDAAAEMLGFIRALPEHYRDVLSLCYVNGLNSRQIAETMGRSDTTVRKQLQRGREILLKKWKENHRD